MANNDPGAATTAHTHHVPVRRGTFELRGVHCLNCAGAVERALREQPHVTDVRLDWKNDLVHGVDTQPISMGTKHDRMQYEMPATHADHGDHADHDMSDPLMAATMERDMRNKFFVALLLTIPTVLYSPLGMNLLGLRLPTFGLGENLIMLLLSTPVVFYSGWIFISGAYHSLRRRTLNMSVLIATGVLP